MKSVVVYYSRTGNTKFIAETIAAQLCADLCEVTDKTKRDGKLTYLTGGFASLREKPTEIEVSKPVGVYDLVVVGSPVWAGKIAPAIRTFLKTTDLSQKLVALFVTLGGDKPEHALQNMKTAFAAKQLVGEFGVTSALDKREQTLAQVAAWCSKLQKSLN
ncbi:MAG: flavodoxin family protein [Candidatus Bathyarchaeia archaeon]|jgi:flavodoxin